jgi:uracil-DNA glycosylase
MPRHDPLSDLIDLHESQPTDGRTVPNQQPILKTQPYRLAIIGEAPGADEIREGHPFVGMSGKFLTGLMSKAGIIRDACFIGNVCQHRPTGNDISNFSREGSEITSGLAALDADFRTFDPYVCLLLGKTALWAAKGVDSISDWRGTFFIGDKPGPFFGRKCLATYHPAAALRQYEYTPLIMFDIRKAFAEAKTRELVVPQRDLQINLTLPELLDRFDRLRRDCPTISVDIEGYIDAMTCISIAPSEKESFLVPFTKWDGSSYWDEDSEVRIWKGLADVLGDPKIGKIFQNGLYDRFVLQWSYDIVVRGSVDDTMLKHWELYCELEKGLGVLVSFYCGNEAYYKFERKSGSQEAQWRYCCKDSAVTYEIATKLSKWLPPSSLKHYQFNHDLLNPILYMENHGLLYDTKLAKERLNQVDSHIHGLQHQLDHQATVDHCLSNQTFGVAHVKTKEGIATLVRSTICHKRDPSRPTAKFVDDYPKVMALLRSSEPLTTEHLGYISMACGLSMNIKSKDFKEYLYETLKLPKQYTKDPSTGQERISTNYESLLKLSKKTTHPAVQLAIDLSSLRTRSQMLHISADADGRIRAGYNIVGSETGRITCYTSPTGSGYNLQTLPDADPLKPQGHPLREGMRDLVVADPGCYLGKCDLKGADGWSVGAHLNRLGDPTMLADLLFGIKPAQVLCWMVRHKVELPSGMDRNEIKKLVVEVKKDDWDYFAFKQCIWGYCYLMGARKAAQHVFNLSEGKVDMKESQMEESKNWLFRRYRVSLWWNWMGDHLRKQKYPPTLVAASGHVRKFFGRERDRLGEALAHEPQANTTYATNSAAWRLWNDPENRIQGIHGGQPNGGSPRILLRVRPMHQVHDELLLQWKIEDTTWAITKIQQWFNNPLTIADQQITIPFEGNYGTNWAMDTRSKVGSI